MKKLFSRICTLLAVTFVLTACSSSGTISLKDVSEKMVKATTLVGELVAMSDENVEMLYTDYDSAIVSEFVVYACASKATAEEISIFKAKDSSKVEDVKKIMEKRVENMKNENRDYNPNEMSKLDSAQIVTKGDYVALIVADDTAPAQKAFQDAF